MAGLSCRCENPYCRRGFLVPPGSSVPPYCPFCGYPKFVRVDMGLPEPIPPSPPPETWAPEPDARVEIHFPPVPHSSEMHESQLLGSQRLKPRWCYP